MAWKYVRAAAALTLIGGGLGWWLHPGIGFLAAGVVVWLDLVGEAIAGFIEGLIK